MKHNNILNLLGYSLIETFYMKKKSLLFSYNYKIELITLTCKNGVNPWWLPHATVMGKTSLSRTEQCQTNAKCNFYSIGVDFRCAMLIKRNEIGSVCFCRIYISVSIGNELKWIFQCNTLHVSDVHRKPVFYRLNKFEEEREKLREDIIATRANILLNLYSIYSTFLRGNKV